MKEETTKVESVSKNVRQWLMLITLVLSSFSATSFAESSEDFQKIMALAQMTTQMTSQAAALANAATENSDANNSASSDRKPSNVNSEEPTSKDHQNMGRQGFSAEGRHSSPKVIP